MFSDFIVDRPILFLPGAPGMLSLDIGPELSTPGSTLELGAAGMLQVYCFSYLVHTPNHWVFDEHIV